MKEQLLMPKKGKTTGVDELPVEVLSGVWCRGLVTPIPKSNSNPLDPLTYRGITITSSVYKLFCSVLLSRLNSWCDEHQIIVDEQNGFRAERSTTDHLITVTTLIESRKLRRRPTYATFIDFKQAYDRIPRNLLFKKLIPSELMGISLKLFKPYITILKIVSMLMDMNLTGLM